MPVDIKSVRDNFKKNLKQSWVLRTPALNNVTTALDNYVNLRTQEILEVLIDRVGVWENKNPKEFKNNGGPALRDAIEDEDFETENAEHEPLKDGDILFRYVPHGVAQRDYSPLDDSRNKILPLQQMISVGQGLQKATQFLRSGIGVREEKTLDGLLRFVFSKHGVNVKKPNMGGAWDRVQHVGIYTEDEGVIEIDGSGLSRNQVDKRNDVLGHPEIDLVVRCDQDSMAKRVSEIARLTKPAKGQEHYPLQDLANLALKPHTGGEMTPTTFVHVGKQGLKFVGDGTQYKMDQTVVCSHFVHAVLWAAVDPAMTVRGTTMHAFENVFKISPAHLWTQFLSKGGVWKKLHASFKGVQQDGLIYEMKEENLEALAVAA